MPTTQPSAANRMAAERVTSRRAIPFAVATSILALLVVGCGSSSPTSSTSRSSRNPVTAAFEFSACMRNHGLANFPDPHVSSGNGQQSKISIHVQLVGGGSAQFKAAQKACRGILPAPSNASATQLADHQHAREQDLLAFAKCLRGHGVPDFPDPTSQGRLTLEMVTAAGVDLHAPIVLTAAKACIGVAHGVITGADVERAINGTQ